MSGEHSPNTVRKAAPARSGKPSRAIDRTVQAVTGRIVRILTGQGHGYIRLPSGREVFFHRADMQEGTALHDLHVGDTVAFDLLDDPVSGPRGLRVRRQERPPRAKR